MLTHDLIPGGARLNHNYPGAGRPGFLAMFSELYYLHFDDFQVFQQFFEVLTIEESGQFINAFLAFVQHFQLSAQLRLQFSIIC